VKSPAARLDARKTGLLAYVRQVRLTAGEYNLVSEVEDLNAGKALTGASPATATDMIPGLTLSGALIVRPLNKQNDLMEGDDIIQYDGKALMPILAPTFVAQEPFTLSVYFIMYPELRGSGPRVRLQLLQDGRPAGGGSVGFSDKIADESRDLSGSSAGEQKHAFPYLSHLAGAVLPAGSYEVKVVVQQDTQEMTRTVPFRVVKK
jgi:hypothetical protein